MRAIDLDRHLRSVGVWVDWEDTVDTFKCGDPQTKVRQRPPRRPDQPGRPDCLPPPTE
jgi:hypothetical protein